MNYFLCLGSNQGEKQKNIKQALQHLERNGVKVLRSSSLYKSEPVGVTGQPWFYNRVVEVETGLLPQELLNLAKKIEQAMGRKPWPRSEPRVIDIDILLAGDTIIDTEELVIPHPQLDKRNFVLIPLGEISPKTVHPVLKKTVEDLGRESRDCSAVIRLESEPL